jgi:hypothetical protein
MSLACVTLAVPCRTDEPALGRTLDAAWASWQAAAQSATHALEVLVCLNGASGESRALADLRGFAAARGVRLAKVQADARAEPTDAQLAVIALCTPCAGKAIAWELLRRRARGATMLFLDADVSFPGDTFGLLLDTLAARRDAILASARTTCEVRSTAFERVMAVPYRIDFPNLSPQLYAARRDGLPASMPQDLFDPEHWLELMVGAEQMVRVPGARVVIRLPGTLADFFRQRIRIEMGKVQLAAEYPDVRRRTVPQPGLRAAMSTLGPVDLLRLATYLALRETAHAIARRRYRRGRTDDVWRQAGTTKRWDAV